MTERQFTISTERVRQHVADYILTLGPQPVMEVIVRKYEKTRSLPQNSRYWASITELLNQLNQTVETVSEHTGYSPLEVKRLIAKELPPEQVAILFCSRPELAHDVMKTICNVPTSTRLNTKQFMQFEDRMIQTVIEIKGQILEFERVAA